MTNNDSTNFGDTTDQEPSAIFDGLRVIDCASVIAAPAAAMMLGEYGADVIKIETPGDGDMLRVLSGIPTTPDVDPALNPASSAALAGADGWFWQLDGHNKRSLTLNLKEASAREILQKLVAGCDVFICNQPYDQRERFGLTWEHLKALNPTMIYASLTAYGEKGEERNRKGFDQLAYWSRSGLMDLMRAPGTSPTQGLPGMGDHPTAVALYAAIVTALLQRERTGEGAFVHTSLLANGIWSAAGIAQGAFAGGDMQAYRETNRVNAAMMRVYEASDGRHLMFNMVRNEELLSLLLAAMDLLHLLADERFQTPELMWEHRADFGDELQSKIAERSSAQWLAVFAEFDLPVNRVALVEDALADAQVRKNLIAAQPASDSGIDLPFMINHPLQISSVRKSALRRAPTLGEHNAEVLAELGYSAEEILKLYEDGAI